MIFFTILVLFKRVLTKLQVFFTDFKNAKYILRYSRSKSEAIIGSLWKAQTKAAKKRLF